MTHLPFLLLSYTFGVAVPGAFGIGAWLRLRATKRRLAAVDPRQGRAL
jgi:hypothetical protein